MKDYVEILHHTDETSITSKEVRALLEERSDFVRKPTNAAVAALEELFETGIVALEVEEDNKFSELTRSDLFVYSSLVDKVEFKEEGNRIVLSLP